MKKIAFFSVMLITGIAQAASQVSLYCAGVDGKGKHASFYVSEVSGTGGGTLSGVWWLNGKELYSAQIAPMSDDGNANWNGRYADGKIWVHSRVTGITLRVQATSGKSAVGTACADKPGINEYSGTVFLPKCIEVQCESVGAFHLDKFR